MIKDYDSPFAPGRPVEPQFFVGRVQQVHDLLERIHRSLAGRIEVVFVSGERGIGKTSLLRFVRWWCDRYRCQKCHREHRIISTHAFLGGVQEISEAVHETIEQMLQESIGRPWHQRLWEALRKHIQEVELGLFWTTVRFAPPQEALEGAVRHLDQTLKHLFTTVKGTSDGMLLIWDDINGLAAQKAFADWLKSAVEKTAFQQVPVCLVLVGLDEVRRSLIRNNESLARILFPLEIPLWSDDECAAFFQRAFDSVNMKVEKTALETMVAFSGGHPALAHEIGDAVFRADDDGVVDEKDVRAGIANAAEIVGRRYLDEAVYQAIRSPRYRKILQVIASDPNNFVFRRSDILQRLTANERQVFDNFLQRMRKLGVIVPEEEGGRGIYRFRNLLHFFYFGLVAQRKGYIGQGGRKR